MHLVGLGPGWRASKARSPSLRCSSGTQSCGWGYPTRRYAGVVAASCAASRACRSCSKEAADYGVTADVPPTVAAPCFRLWAGSASRDTALTGERKNNIGLSMSRPGCLCRGIALRRSYLGVATRRHLTLLFIFSLLHLPLLASTPSLPSYFPLISCTFSRIDPILRLEDNASSSLVKVRGSSIMVAQWKQNARSLFAT